MDSTSENSFTETIDATCTQRYTRQDGDERVVFESEEWEFVVSQSVLDRADVSPRVGDTFRLTVTFEPTGIGTLLIPEVIGVSLVGTN